jgi:hypothetical protein
LKVADDIDEERQRHIAGGRALRDRLGHAVTPVTMDTGTLSNDASSTEALAALAEALGRAPDPEEAVAWASMTPGNHRLVIRRIQVLRQWTESRGDMTAADAADAVGLKIARFYDLASRWSAGKKRIFDVGRFAGSQSERRGRFDAGLLNELQAAVPTVVGNNRSASVSRQVDLLAAAVDLKGRALPGRNSMREIVERERRRLDTRRQAGTEIGFDVVGSGLLRSKGGQHVIYAVIDRTARLIMGFAIGELEDSVAGYAAAAADALRWMHSAEASGIAWTSLTDRIDVVPGCDADWWSALDRKLCPVECGLADGKRSRGRYFRQFVGPRLGRLKLTAATGTNKSVEAAPDEAVDDDMARLRLRVEIAAHNAAVRREMNVEGEVSPAPTTIAALQWMAALAEGSGQAHAST